MSSTENEAEMQGESAQVYVDASTRRPSTPSKFMKQLSSPVVRINPQAVLRFRADEHAAAASEEEKPDTTSPANVPDLIASSDAVATDIDKNKDNDKEANKVTNTSSPFDKKRALDRLHSKLVQRVGSIQASSTTGVGVGLERRGSGAEKKKENSNSDRDMESLSQALEEFATHPSPSCSSSSSSAVGAVDVVNIFNGGVRPDHNQGDKDIDENEGQYVPYTIDYSSIKQLLTETVPTSSSRIIPPVQLSLQQELQAQLIFAHSEEPLQMQQRKEQEQENELKQYRGAVSPGHGRPLRPNATKAYTSFELLLEEACASGEAFPTSSLSQSQFQTQFQPQTKKLELTKTEPIPIAEAVTSPVVPQQALSAAVRAKASRLQASSSPSSFSTSSTASTSIGISMMSGGIVRTPTAQTTPQLPLSSSSSSTILVPISMSALTPECARYPLRSSSCLSGGGGSSSSSSGDRNAQTRRSQMLDVASLLNNVEATTLERGVGTSIGARRRGEEEMNHRSIFSLEKKLEEKEKKKLVINVTTNANVDAREGVRQEDLDKI